jgi:biotin carboxyl carrier protein
MEIEQGRGLLVMTQAFKSTIKDKSFSIKILSECELEIDGQVCKYDLSELDGSEYSLLLDGSSHSIQLIPDLLDRSAEARQSDGEIGRSLTISVDGSVYSVCVDDHRSMLLKSYFNQPESSAGVQVVRAPMPGLISRIEVKPGDEVSVGKALVVLEAMKMENEIRSLYHGRVLEIRAEKGRAVEKGEELITIEETAKP